MSSVPPPRTLRRDFAPDRAHKLMSIEHVQTWKKNIIAGWKMSGKLVKTITLRKNGKVASKIYIYSPEKRIQEWYENEQILRASLKWRDGNRYLETCVYECGVQEWYADDQYHRDDGPAIIWIHGDREWWLNGSFLYERNYL